MWKTNERIHSVRKIGDLELPEPPKEEKIEYVLDGQQRIASLYAAYMLALNLQKKGEKKITDYKKIFVNLEIDIHNNSEQIIVVLPEEPAGNNITLHKLLRYNEYFAEIEKYSTELRIKIHNYYCAFTQYDFSIVLLRRNNIDSAIDVFTRIIQVGKF